MVTSHDVARAVGVSQSTVSRVIRGSGRVSPDVRARVLRAIDELGYVPNAQAKAMRSASSSAIGVVTAELLNPYVPRLLDAITHEARRRGLNILLWNDDDPTAPMAQVGVSSGLVDGVLFTAARESTTGAELLARRGVPVVLANRAPADGPFDSVTTDHDSAGYNAAAYFLQHGHDDIAAIFGPRDTYSSPAREAGFRRRLAEAGLVVPSHRWLVGETSYQHGWESAERLIAAQEVPRALFCSADLIAFGAISALRRHGLRVPDDLWVMGNDGLPMSAWDPFDLTTHRQPIEEIAAGGMAQLISRMSGETGAPVHQRLSTELIVRGSTAHA